MKTVLFLSVFFLSAPSAFAGTSYRLVDRSAYAGRVVDRMDLETKPSSHSWSITPAAYVPRYSRIAYLGLQLNLEF